MGQRGMGQRLSSALVGCLLMLILSEGKLQIEIGLIFFNVFVFKRFKSTSEEIDVPKWKYSV